MMPPATQEGPEGAETFTYYGYEKTGFAKIISNYATDLPRVDIKGEMKTGYVKGIGDSYGYNVQEMRASRMAGKSLDTRRGESARYHIDRLTNTLAWRGDTANKLIGVLSEDNGIPVLTLEDGATSQGENWLTKNADEIIDDVKTALAQMDSTTQHVEIPDTLGIPSDVYIGLSLKRIPDTNISVLKYLQENLPNIQIKSCPELNSTSVETNPYAKASAGQGVGILYKYDADKLSIEIPMPFLQHPVQYENLEVKIPCESRVAAAVIYVFTFFFNFLVPSGSGKAAIVMPLLVPMADMADITRQTAVLAYQLGDGPTNLFWPTAAMAALAMGNVPYSKWFKWYLPLTLVIFVVSIIIVVICAQVGYGPF